MMPVTSVKVAKTLLHTTTMNAIFIVYKPSEQLLMIESLMYQGELLDENDSMNGLVAITINLFNSDSRGKDHNVWSLQLSDVNVIDGQFNFECELSNPVLCRSQNMAVNLSCEVTRE